MFDLDVNAAKTDDSVSNRINESGIYTGTITKAEWSKSLSSQAQFFNIDFESDDGKTANYMSICFKKGDGTNSFGYNIMNKIMACCAVRKLTSVQMGEKLTCPELTNVRVKFALQAEHGWFEDKNSGEQRQKVDMIISVPFKADTGQSAKEVLESLPASQVNTIKVTDRKPKEKPAATQAPASYGTPPPQMAPQYNTAPPAESNQDYDEDTMPF